MLYTEKILSDNDFMRQLHFMRDIVYTYKYINRRNPSTSTTKLQETKNKKAKT